MSENPTTVIGRIEFTASENALQRRHERRTIQAPICDYAHHGHPPTMAFAMKSFEVLNYNSISDN
jgi:hypothetical protein